MEDALHITVELCAVQKFLHHTIFPHCRSLLPSLTDIFIILALGVLLPANLLLLRAGIPKGSVL